MRRTECKQLRIYTKNYLLLVSQHCNFMISNFVYFYIFLIPIRATQYLDKRAGLVRRCLK
jgi:hypothetical protein